MISFKNYFNLAHSVFPNEFLFFPSFRSFSVLSNSIQIPSNSSIPNQDFIQFNSLNSSQFGFKKANSWAVGKQLRFSCFFFSNGKFTFSIRIGSSNYKTSRAIFNSIRVTSSKQKKHKNYQNKNYCLMLRN